MTFLRPEALDVLRRWREAMIGAALVLAGGVGAFNGYGLFFAACLAVALLGAALTFTGLRHALFRVDGDAPGVVEITEGRITYLGPVIGGTIALSDLREVAFRRTTTGEAFWRLTGLEAQPLIIPAGARDVDGLLDAFTALPRFDTGAMVRAVQSRTPTARVIWRHPARTEPFKTLT